MLGAMCGFYAKECGDAEGALVKGDVQDLKDEPFEN